MTESLGRLLTPLAQPLVDPTSRTFAGWLAVAALVAFAWAAMRGHRGWLLVRKALAPQLWLHPSSRADLVLFVVRRLISAVNWLPEIAGSAAFAIAIARFLDRTVGPAGVEAPPEWLLALGYTAVLFIVWDASRYAIHRLMHAIPVLWAFHQVHHSAEVLTPLSFHRIHPVESLIYTLRGVLVSGGVGGLAYWLFRGQAVAFTILGAHGIGMVLNAATGNLRHSHVWLSFGPRVERWWISPAQHQLHHSARAMHCNFGTWLALWDRLGGSLVLAQAPPERLGLFPEDCNHDPRDAVSMLFRPFVAAVLLVAPVARAGDPAAPASDEEPQYEVIVEAPEGVPRVAGSAHVQTEAQLDRFEYDDIHQVLAIVPGVYVRSEDGFGLRPNIGMRGGNADRSARISLMEDGVLLGPAPYAAPAAYYFPMVSRMTAVEVFKGPAAIRHGPQTIGGAVNLQTREVPVDGADGAIDVALGLRSTASANGWVGGGNERRGWVLDASHLSSDGFKTLDTGGPTGFDRQDVMLKTRLSALELKLGYGREHSWETYLGITAADFAADPNRRYAASDGDEMAWNRTQAELSWQARLGRRVDLEVVGYHHYLDRAWTKLNRFAGGPDLHDLLQSDPGGQAAVYLGILRGEEDTASPDQALMRGTNDRQFHSGGVQSMLEIRSRGERVDNTLELGLRLHADRVARLHTEVPHDMLSGAMIRSGPRQTILDSRTAADALAAHVHDTLDLGRLELFPGLRTEVIRTAAGDSSTGPVDPIVRTIALPGFGFLVQATRDLELFGGVHRGFSPVPPGSPVEARPESAWSYEAGVRATPAESHFEAVGFWSDYAQITGQCTLSSGCDESQLDAQFEGGAATITGLEALASHRVHLPGRIAVTTDASYTLTVGRFRTSFVSEFPQFGSVSAGDHLPYVPTHQAAVQIAAEHQRFTAGFAARGRSPLRDGAGQGEIPDAVAIPATATLDVSGSLALTERVRVYGTLTNLTNAQPVESWRPFGARPGAPRQAMVGVKGAVR